MKKYLSLYKTSSEHSADNSRLVPNISLITDEKKMILTNENNIGTIFKEVDIIESFDDIINRFPTGNSTGMPGLKIYGDNTDQSKAKNIKLLNDAQEYRSNYISNHGLSDTGQSIRINVDALLIDNIIMDKYDGNYQYYIDIYSNFIYIYYSISNIASISNDGSFYYANNSFVFPSPTETRMPSLLIYTGHKDYNIILYNRAQQWRKDYISYKGLSDTGQPISMFIDSLDIDMAYMDEYDNSYNYHIDIYNDRIILLNDSDNSEVLIISSDGSVTILDIFNKFPSATSSNMPGLKIYIDNTDYSKANNIKIYNDAQQYRKDYISNNNLSDTGQRIRIFVDALIVNDKLFDKYDGGYYNFISNLYNLDIYKDHIFLKYLSLTITIYSDGSVDTNITPIPYTPTPTTTR